MLIVRSWYAGVKEKSLRASKYFSEKGAKSETDVSRFTDRCWFLSVFWHNVQLLALVMRMRAHTCAQRISCAVCINVENTFFLSLKTSFSIKTPDVKHHI